MNDMKMTMQNAFAELLRVGSSGEPTEEKLKEMKENLKKIQDVLERAKRVTDEYESKLQNRQQRELLVGLQMKQKHFLAKAASTPRWREKYLASAAKFAEAHTILSTPAAQSVVSEYAS